MQKTNINGAEIAFRVDGPESLPWLVLSNSLAADMRMWSPQIDDFTQSHRVLRYDTRGHGNSEPVSAPYSFDNLVGDVIGLMDEVGIQSADILGLSLGGMTALGLALDHPDRVNRIICCDARADAPADYVNGWRERIAIAEEKCVGALGEGTLERWLTQEFRSDARNAGTVEGIRLMIASTSVEGFCGCASALMELNYLERLGEIDAPALFIVGDNDMAAPAAVMERMAGRVQTHDFVVLENAGHLSNVNNPNDFNKTVSGWLRNA